MADGLVETALTQPPGVRFQPRQEVSTAALVVAGSSGRVDRERARLLAGTGVLAESIQWFGGPGQPAAPVEIPLETFADRVAALRSLVDRVVLVGVSFGAEAALATAAHTGGVDAVVAFAPSDVMWAGVRDDGTQTAHWTLGGRPLPFVLFDEGWQPTTRPPAYRELYRLSRRADPAVTAAATIEVERIPRVTLVVGGDDQVWPSDEHADAIAVRRRGFGLESEIVADAEAGHRVILPGEPVVADDHRLVRGGNPHADARLGALAWPALVRAVHGIPN